MYDCPKCAVRLRSSIDQVGHSDFCPECAAVFQVPGLELLEQESPPASPEILEPGEVTAKEGTYVSDKLAQFESQIANASLPSPRPKIKDVGLTDDHLIVAERIISDQKMQLAHCESVVESAFSLFVATAVVAVLYLATHQPIILILLPVIVLGIPPLQSYTSAITAKRKSIVALHPRHVILIDLATRFWNVQIQFDLLQQRLDDQREAEERIRTAEDRLRELNIRRLQESHWMQMSGRTFELEIGALYGKLGFDSAVTRASVDGGIDINLRKDGEYWVVQCKRQNSKVGVKVIRELYGVMHAAGADRCILACPAGFNRNVHKFAKGKPITLLGMSEIILLAKQAGGENSVSGARRGESA